VNLIVAAVASGVLAVVTAVAGMAAYQDEPAAPRHNLVQYADE